MTIPADTVFYGGRGCKKCLGSGYLGRLAIYEILVITPRLAQAVEKGLPTSKLRDLALEEGLVDLASAGMEHVLAGNTTVEEVFYKVSS
jgi:type II secretory ATPase GspE/PulE/Tfp pilus assembly ATPase PilB-like protein